MAGHERRRDEQQKPKAKRPGVCLRPVQKGERGGRTRRGQRYRQQVIVLFDATSGLLSQIEQHATCHNATGCLPLLTPTLHHAPKAQPRQR